jgi:hypothetical protein
MIYKLKDDVRQRNSASDTVCPLYAVFCGAYASLDRTGQEGIRIPGRGSPGRSALDLLDLDDLGFPGQYAAIHDGRLASGGDAASAEVV